MANLLTLITFIFKLDSEASDPARAQQLQMLVQSSPSALNDHNVSFTSTPEIKLEDVNFGNCKTESSSLRRALRPKSSFTGIVCLTN